MTWREDLRRVTIGGRILIGASFRGVPFFVQESDRGGGRRVVTHKFPLRDDPYIEDLGRDARTFRLEGYVVGDDYLTQRDALLSALEDEEGPGELVHPYHGVRRAICSSVSVRETRDEGGQAVFSIQFDEAPTQAPVPTQVVDPAGAVSDSGAAAATAARAELVEQFKTGMPSFTNASAESVVTKMVAGLSAQVDKVYNAVWNIQGAISDATTQELANVTGQLAVITAEASSVVGSPGFTFDQFSAALDSLELASEAAPEDVMNAFLDAYSTDVGPAVVPTTSNRASELANQTALTAALQRLLLVAAAKLAPLVKFTTIDDAIAARDQITALLDAQAEIAGDTAYPSLVDLRSQVQRAVPGSSSFSSVVTVTRDVAIPSIVLAYQLYGSVDNELDIVARNDIPHPGFVYGSLKVLGNG